MEEAIIKATNVHRFAPSVPRFSNGSVIGIGSMMWDRKTGRISTVSEVTFSDLGYAVNGGTLIPLDESPLVEWAPVMSHNGHAIHVGDVIMGRSDRKLFRVIGIDMQHTHPVEVDALRMPGEHLRLKLDWVIGISYFEDSCGNGLVQGMRVVQDGTAYVIIGFDAKLDDVYVRPIEDEPLDLILPKRPSELTAAPGFASRFA